MAEMTLEQARKRGADGWTSGGRTYRLLVLAIQESDVGDIVTALDDCDRPTARELADELMTCIGEWACEDSGPWVFLAQMSGEDVDGCVLDQDDQFKALLLAACERAIDHYGHPRQPQFESIDWIRVTPELWEWAHGNTKEATDGDE